MRADNFISLQVAQEALTLFEIDANGLDHLDRRILLTVQRVFEWGGPVSVESLAAASR